MSWDCICVQYIVGILVCDAGAENSAQKLGGGGVMWELQSVLKSLTVS